MPKKASLSYTDLKSLYVITPPTFVLICGCRNTLVIDEMSRIKSCPRKKSHHNYNNRDLCKNAIYLLLCRPEEHLYF